MFAYFVPFFVPAKKMSVRGGVKERGGGCQKLGQVLAFCLCFQEHVAIASAPGTAPAMPCIDDDECNHGKKESLQRDAPAAKDTVSLASRRRQPGAPVPRSVHEGPLRLAGKREKTKGLGMRPL